MRRGTCCRPAVRASSAWAHQDLSEGRPSRRILAPPCPSMAPLPMMDEPVALRAATSGRHPAGASLTRPQEPSESS